MDNKLKLHEAIEVVIKEIGPSRAKQIATLINSRNLYERKDGFAVQQGQISARINNYPNLFSKDDQDGKIHLASFSKPSENHSAEEMVDVIWRYSNAKSESPEFTYITLYLSYLYSEGYEFENQTLNCFIAELKRGFDGFVSIKSFVSVFTGLQSNQFKKIVAGLEKLESNSLKSNFSFVFETFLSRIKSERLRGFEGQNLSKELSQVIAQFIEPSKINSAYLPFAGGANVYFDNNFQFQAFAQELSREVFSFTQLRSLAHKTEKFNVLNEDSKRNWPQEKFDLIFSYPPLGGELGRVSNLEYLLNNSIKALKEEGLFIAVVRKMFLTSKAGYIGGIKKQLVDSGWLKSVIVLPSEMFKPSLDLAIIVVKKEASKDKLQIIDATEESIGEKSFSKSNKLDLTAVLKLINNPGKTPASLLASRKDIASKNYDLLPTRYKFLGSFDNYLKDILVPINKTFHGENKGLFVSPNDLSENEEVLKLESLKLKSGGFNSFQKITKDCLLICNTTKPRATWFTFDNRPIFLAKNVLAFDVKRNFIHQKDNLISVLNSTDFKNRYSMFLSGISIKIISLKDLLNLGIDLSTVEKKSIDSGEQSKSLQARFKKDIASKQHNIRQHLMNAVDSAQNLKLLLDRDGKIEANQVINPKNPDMTVLKRILALNRSLENVVFEVNHLDTEQNFGAIKSLSIKDLLKEAIQEQVQNELYSISKPVYSVELDELSDSYLEVLSNKIAFKEAFNNIIENAKKHGFVDDENQYQIKIDIHIENEWLVMLLSNNGAPFPEGLIDKIGIRGVKAGETGNTGIGAHRIIEIMEHYKGTAIPHNLSNQEFPVVWELKFKLSNL